jgi:hypothetical protein
VCCRGVTGETFALALDSTKRGRLSRGGQIRAASCEVTTVRFIPHERHATVRARAARPILTEGTLVVDEWKIVHPLVGRLLPSLHFPQHDA